MASRPTYCNLRDLGKICCSRGITNVQAPAFSGSSCAHMTDLADENGLSALTMASYGKGEISCRTQRAQSGTESVMFRVGTHLYPDKDDPAIELALRALLGEVVVHLARQQDDTLHLGRLGDLLGQDRLERGAFVHLGERRCRSLSEQGAKSTHVNFGPMENRA